MAHAINPIKGLKELWSDDIPEDSSEDHEMTILEHLSELRYRIVIIAAALLIGTFVALIFTGSVLEWLKQPKPAGAQLIFIQVTENFVTYFKVALISGFTIALPIIFYQLINFIAPALTKREKRLLFSVLPLILLFFLSGMFFGYYVTLPFALQYLLTFGADFATAQIRIGDYISFVLTVLVAMGLAFELPVVLLVITKLGIVDARRLAKFRRYWLVVAFVVAAVITPTPDPINQTLVAVPLIVLYEVGLLLSRWSPGKPRVSAPEAKPEA